MMELEHRAKEREREQALWSLAKRCPLWRFSAATLDICVPGLLTSFREGRVGAGRAVYDARALLSRSLGAGSSRPKESLDWCL